MSEKKRLIVNGLDVQYTDQGTGSVTLLLHGWGTNQTTFNALIEAWPVRDRRFITLDLPGFGGSETPSESWDVSTYAKFVQYFLQKLSLDSLEMIVGHSLGGRIIIKGLSKKYFTPSYAVLIAAAGAAKRRTLRNTVFKIVAKIGKAALAIPPLSLLRTQFRAKLYAAAGSTDYMDAGAMRDTFVRIVQENLTADAQRITVPTLLLWGEDDTTTPTREAEILQNAILGSKLNVIPNAEHFVHETHAVDVAKYITEFTENI